jgi:PEP-CTERM motif
MKPIHARLPAFLGALAFTLFVPFVQAAPFTNGGFETGDFTGWTQTGDTSFSGVDAFAAQSGSFGAFFGPEDAGGIAQTFTTAAGLYQVSFLLELDDSAQPNSFRWAWNGVTQALALTNVAGFPYTSFSAMVTATGASSTLSFTFVDPQSFWLLDNVSVTAVTAAVPEPSTLLLLGAGLAWVARRGTRRQRRS